MENPRNKPLLLLSKLHVVRVGADGRPGPRLSGESSLTEFERVWPLLEPALVGGEHNKESVFFALGQGERLLWTGKASAVVTEIFTHPSGLKVMLIWLAGGDLEEFMPWLPAVENWGREHGATEARISGRRGWMRKTGYKELRTLMVKDLGHADA